MQCLPGVVVDDLGHGAGGLRGLGLGDEGALAALHERNLAREVEGYSGAEQPFSEVATTMVLSRCRTVR